MKTISNKRQVSRVLNPDYPPQMRLGLLMAKDFGLWVLNWNSLAELVAVLEHHLQARSGIRHNKSRERAPEIEREICTSLNSVSASIKFKGTGESSRGYWASVNTSKHAPSCRFIFQFKKIGHPKKHLFLITEIGEQRRTSQEAS